MENESIDQELNSSKDKLEEKLVEDETGYGYRRGGWIDLKTGNKISSKQYFDRLNEVKEDRFIAEHYPEGLFKSDDKEAEKIMRKNFRARSMFIARMRKGMKEIDNDKSKEIELLKLRIQELEKENEKLKKTVYSG